jgi:trigger factor
LSATVIDQGNCKKQLRLDIPSDAVREKIDAVAADLARKVSLPGFRPGHVPKSVVKTRLRKELRDEVSSQLIPPAFEEAVHENGLKVIGRPALDAVVFGEDESLSVTFNLDVAPEFDLAEYKNIPLTRRIYKITDEHVNAAIEAFRKQQGELVPVDRPAQVGDNVLVDIKGRFIEPSGAEIADAPPESLEITQQELSIVLGGDGVMEEFTKVFTGASAGETKTFTLTYREDHPTPRLAGKTARYTAEVAAVRIVELPELNDEFAASVNEEFKDLDALRAHVRQDLEDKMADRSDSEIKAEAVAELVSRNRFEVPGVLVDHRTQSMVRNFARGLHSRGINVRDPKLDWESLIEAQRPLAEKEVRSAFVLGKIAESEKLEVSDQEVEADIEDMAAASGKSVEAVRANLTKENALNSIKEQIHLRKALDFVISSASITVEEATEPISAEEGEQPTQASVSE